MSILIFIIVLAVLIIVHEYGHFIVAKKGGVRVDEFGLGYPPRARTLWKKNGTEFTLNWLPFGGFVKIYGENPEEEHLTGEHHGVALVNKPGWLQALVLFAGPFFNFLFAWVLIFVTLLAGLPTSIDSDMNPSYVSQEKIVINDVTKDSPAALSGLQANDILKSVSVQSKTYENIETSELHNLVVANPKSTFSFVVERKSKEVTLTAVPNSDMMLGIGLSKIGIYKPSFWKAIPESFKFTGVMIANISMGLWSLIAGIFTGGADFANITGPVGIVGLVGDASKQGLIYLLSFTALISINLGIINLIPFPALDGGRLLFLIIEKIKGGRVNHVILNAFNTIGFGLLIMLMLFVTYKDIIRLL